jgi:hypothetical protein
MQQQHMMCGTYGHTHTYHIQSDASTVPNKRAKQNKDMGSVGTLAMHCQNTCGATRACSILSSSTLCTDLPELHRKVHVRIAICAMRGKGDLTPSNILLTLASKSQHLMTHNSLSTQYSFKNRRVSTTLCQHTEPRFVMIA